MAQYEMLGARGPISMEVDVQYRPVEVAAAGTLYAREAAWPPPMPYHKKVDMVAVRRDLPDNITPILKEYVDMAGLGVKGTELLPLLTQKYMDEVFGTATDLKLGDFITHANIYSDHALEIIDAKVDSAVMSNDVIIGVTPEACTDYREKCLRMCNAQIKTVAALSKIITTVQSRAKQDNLQDRHALFDPYREYRVYEILEPWDSHMVIELLPLRTIQKDSPNMTLFDNLMTVKFNKDTVEHAFAILYKISSGDMEERFKKAVSVEMAHDIDKLTADMTLAEEVSKADIQRLLGIYNQRTSTENILSRLSKERKARNRQIRQAVVRIVLSSLII